MGSVIDHIECPNCKREAFSDFYYKTGEEYTYCQNCGYNKSASIINRDKKLSDLTEEDWEIKENLTPAGAFRVKEYNTSGEFCGSFNTLESMENMIADIKRNPEDVEFFAVNKFVNGEFTTEIIIDNRKDDTTIKSDDTDIQDV